MPTSHYDLAVIGGGIVGTAHAYHAAKAKQKVALFERNDRPVGATIRNFGMIWPIGQVPDRLERALRSRQHWLDLAEKSKFWAPTAGSLHLAYQTDEMEVLTEFADLAGAQGYQVNLLSPENVAAYSPGVKTEGLLGAMYSDTEVNVDPRQAILQIHAYLDEQLGVDLYYRHTIREINYPHLHTAEHSWTADRIIVAGGDDLSTLYPELLAQAPLQHCKLQMMRTAPQANNWQLGANLAGGLTLQHYAAFAQCQHLPALKARIARERPAYNQYGIHVMVSQTALGELTIGDSHEYDYPPSPFDKQVINQLILDYLHRFAKAPDLEIAEYWHGVYAKMMNGATELILHPEPGVTIVTGLGGAGMTFSFGLAEEVILEEKRLTGA